MQKDREGETMTHKPGMFEKIDRACLPLVVCGAIYVAVWMLPQAIKYAMSR